MNHGSALSAILCSAWLAVSSAQAQISPGPLSSPHASIDTSKDCFRCHGGGDDTAADRLCLECHSAVARTIEDGSGFHGHEARQDCSSCHPDHGGRDFALIEWPQKNRNAFDHRRTGFRLIGAHTRVECTDCHKIDNLTNGWKELIPKERLETTFLGLGRECLDCHVDAHEGSLSAKCTDCHTQLAWSPAAAFDHERTDFPRTGKHLEVPCRDCHKQSTGEKLLRFRQIPYGQCSACHKDPHTGRLGDECSACHSTDDFRKVEKIAFDHNRTQYPLRGRHADLECKACHDPGVKGSDRPVFQNCRDCHADLHRGEATLAGRQPDCANCHTVNGFVPSTLDASVHKKTEFPLEGGHRKALCSGCHRTGIAKDEFVFHPTERRCVECHRNAHGDQLSPTAAGQGCESCHNTADWKSSTFTIAAHDRTRFPLEGAHRESDCVRCHAPAVLKKFRKLPPTVLGSAGIPLVSLETDCEACHLDPHGERLGEMTGDGDCSSCHGSVAFRPANTDATAHDRFRFALKSAHRAIPCVDCHDTLREAVGGSFVRGDNAPTKSLSLEIVERECADCHKTPHGDQFIERRDGENCSSCHDQRAFRPASGFDHDRDASFALGGAHSAVACRKCHLPVRGEDGSEQIIYRPLSADCRSCHGPQQGDSR